MTLVEAQVGEGSQVRLTRLDDGQAGGLAGTGTFSELEGLAGAEGHVLGAAEVVANGEALNRTKVDVIV